MSDMDVLLVTIALVVFTVLLLVEVTCDAEWTCRKCGHQFTGAFHDWLNPFGERCRHEGTRFEQ